jgi:hypothetical protein
MVLFQKYVWRFGPLTKMAPTAGMKCRTQFWKGTTQGSFQQSLVEIGSVVSEEKIFFNFIPPFFLFLAWWPYDPWVVPFQNCVWHFRLPSKMAATAELNLT